MLEQTPLCQVYIRLEYNARSEMSQHKELETYMQFPPPVVSKVESIFHLVFLILRNTLERLVRSPPPASFQRVFNEQRQHNQPRSVLEHGGPD